MCHINMHRAGCVAGLTLLFRSQTMRWGDCTAMHCTSRVNVYVCVYTLCLFLFTPRSWCDASIHAFIYLDCSHTHQFHNHKQIQTYRHTQAQWNANEENELYVGIFTFHQIHFNCRSESRMNIENIWKFIFLLHTLHLTAISWLHKPIWLIRMNSLWILHTFFVRRLVGQRFDYILIVITNDCQLVFAKINCSKFVVHFIVDFDWRPCWILCMFCRCRRCCCSCWPVWVGLCVLRCVLRIVPGLYSDIDM